MANIATFSPPLKAICDRDELPRIVVGIQDGPPGEETAFLTVDMNGRFEWIGQHNLTVEWRYDPKSETWDDAHPNVLGDDDE